MRYLNLRGRDNARTPMQWDDTASAGFTTGTPWIKVGPDYETVNAKNEMADPDSVYNYYKKLIHLRKEKDIMVYGTYELLDPEDEALYVYTRTLGDQKLLVMCNFTKEEQEELDRLLNKFCDCLDEQTEILKKERKERKERSDA